MQTQLPRPDALSEAQWDTNELHLARLERAVAAQDWSLALGCSKELCESVARQVVTATGGTVSNHVKMPTLLGGAHQALDRRAGHGAATSLDMKRITGSLSTIVTEIAEARNTHGTGHGRATSPMVTEEYALLAVDAAVTWSRWALRRVDLVAIGRSVSLQRRLVRGTFTSGELAVALDALDIATLPEQEAHALGTAVGQRAAAGTFVVRIDGVERIDSSGDWPSAYVLGVAEGSLWNENGYLQTTSKTVRAVVEALSSCGDEQVHEHFRQHVEASIGADTAHAMTLQDRAQVASTLEELAEANGSPPLVRLMLVELAEAFRPDVRTEAQLAVWEDPMARFLNGSAEAQSANGAFTLWEAIARISPDQYPLSLSGRLFEYEELVRVCASLLYPSTSLAPSALQWLQADQKLTAEVVRIVESRGFGVDSSVRELLDPDDT